MPAPIVLVHDEPAVAAELAAALMHAGYEVATFKDALEAMVALDAPDRIQLLITRAAFADGRSNGFALARMLRLRRPAAKILFMARPEYETEAAEIGMVAPRGSSVKAILDLVRAALNSDSQRSTQG